MCVEVDCTGRHIKIRCDVEERAAAVRHSVPHGRPNSVLRGFADKVECAQCSIDAANQAGRQELGVLLGQ